MLLKVFVFPCSTGYASLWPFFLDERLKQELTRCVRATLVWTSEDTGIASGTPDDVCCGMLLNMLIVL